MRGFVTSVVAAALLATTPSAFAGTGLYGYGFELAGPPTPAGAGKNIVAVQLIHGGKPVVGAVIMQSRADMTPIGMAAMAAPIKPLGEQPPGTYRFEVDNGSVWKKSDNWSLSFGAKVQGEAQTVTGSVTVKLAP